MLLTRQQAEQRMCPVYQTNCRVDGCMAWRWSAARKVRESYHRETGKPLAELGSAWSHEMVERDLPREQWEPLHGWCDRLCPGNYTEMSWRDLERYPE